jgi:manganese/zinc/iron transport system substrate-binding protein
VEKPVAPSSKSSTFVKVLSTTAMIDDIVAKVGGDRVERQVLIIGEIDPHGYELVKGDDEKITESNLVFFNGLNLEHGASLRYKITSHADAISLGDFVLKNYQNEILFEEMQPDPHIWMDVSLWAHVIEPVLNALVSKDPEGKEYYEKRAQLAREEMNKAHQEIRQKLQQVPENLRYLVTSHDAFAYFTRAYLASYDERKEGTWKKRMAAPEGFSPDGQLGAADLQKIVDYLVEYQVHVVFPESNVSPDSLRKIVFACKEKGIEVHMSSKALYGDSMGPSGSASGNYLGMIDYDADVLMKEWSH